MSLSSPPPTGPLSEWQVGRWLGPLTEHTRQELTRRGYQAKRLREGFIIDLLYAHHGVVDRVADRAIELRLIPPLESGPSSS